MKNSLLIIVILLFFSSGLKSQNFRHAMRIFPDSSKFNVAKDALKNKGWYYSQAGIVSTPTDYIASYRRSDFHNCNFTDIMVAYSKDGRNWSGNHSISFGKRSSSQKLPMLSEWQKPGRGMSNHLFWSNDDGKTWTDPHKIDDIGGVPGYITEMKDGKLIYTRTISKKTNKLWNPPMPWGDIYYKNESVRSLDGGKTWEKPVSLADNPFMATAKLVLWNLGQTRY